MKQNQVQSRDAQIASKQNQFKKLLSQVKLRCPYNKTAAFYCDQCEQIAVMCLQQICQCHLNHKKCSTQKKKDFVHNKIDAKLMKANVNDAVKGFIQSLKDEISSLQDKIEEQLGYFGLDDADKKFFKLIQSYSRGERKVSGREIREYLQQCQKGQDNWLQESLAFFSQLTESTTTRVKRRIKQINKVILDEHIRRSQFFDKIPNGFIDSNIVNDDQEFNNLNNMLVSNQRQSIQKVERIYCGSIDGFQLGRFNEKLRGQGDLLFLVENVLGKKYGAFCSTVYSPELNSQWQSDPQALSFIFSLNCNAKSQIVKSKGAFHYSRTFQNGLTSLIAFGGDQFIIGQNSDKHPTYNFISLHNASIYQRQQIQFKKLNGHQSRRVMLKEMEVFKVLFAQKDAKRQSPALNDQQQVENTEVKPRKKSRTS